MRQKTDYYNRDKWESRQKHLYHREKIALNLMLPFLNKNSNFLDVGCSDCTFLHELSHKKLTNNLFGIDGSEFQLKKAKIKNPSFHLKKGDLEEQWPFSENSFDFIYGAEIIEHVHSPDFFLSESNRILKKGGYIVLSTPNLCAWFNRLIFPLGFQPFFYETSKKPKLIGRGIFKKLKGGETPVGHIRVFNIDAIKDLLTDNNFEILVIKGTLFDSGFPKWLLPIDTIFTLLPSLSTGFVILAKKIK